MTEITQAARIAAAKVHPHSHNSALILDGERDGTDIVRAAQFAIDAVQGAGEVATSEEHRNQLYDKVVQHSVEIGAAKAEIARLQGELRKALREVSKWARVAGEAQGKLEGSELAGVVDGWREKCKALEVDNASLTDELAKMIGQAKFLLARLDELDWSLPSFQEFANEFSGHVDPAISRLRDTVDTLLAKRPT